MSHLGQRLSALIDGELDPSERERVLIHISRCAACREEVTALRMLKRRMNALGEAAAGAALTGLTGRLMGLSQLGSGRLDPSQLGQGPPQPGSGEAGWDPAESGEQWQFPGRDEKSEQRFGRYFLAGSLAVFMAGLGTAAFIAGGEPQPSAPAPPVVPSVDVMVVPHQVVNGPVATPSPEPREPRPMRLGFSASDLLAKH